jgi:hypothetical protein
MLAEKRCFFVTILHNWACEAMCESKLEPTISEVSDIYILW